MPETPRVALVVPGFLVGGVASPRCRLVLALAQCLRQADAAVATIVTAGPAADRLTCEGIAVEVLRNDNPAPRAEAAVPGALWLHLRQFEIVHVHEALSGFGGYAATVAISLGRRLVLTDHGGGANAVMGKGAGLQLAHGLVSMTRYRQALIASKYTGLHAVVPAPVATHAIVVSPQTAGLHVQASADPAADPAGQGLLEAMAQGRPVAVMAGGALAELAADDRWGRSFRDEAELAAIQAAVRSGTWRPDGHAARRHVEDHNSFAVVGALLGDFYAAVCR